MKISYFAIYDKKSVSFGQVFPSNTPGSAERSFLDSIKNPDSVHGKYPDDFALYHIFDFDDDVGHVVTVHEPPLLIVQASQLV